MSRAPGWLKIHRQMADAHDRLWSERREFSQWEARFDLLMQARFAPGVYATVHGEDFLARGELVASLNYLAERWQWERKKVARFLKKLSQHDFLSVQRMGHHGTVYLVVNYERYQGDESDSGTATGIDAGQERDKRKEGKKVRTTGVSGKRTWVTAYCEAWKAQHGTDLLVAKAATFLSKVEKDLGADECLARWRRYLVKTPLIYASAADFSQKHSAFTGDTPAGSGDKADWFKKNGYGA